MDAEPARVLRARLTRPAATVASVVLAVCAAAVIFGMTGSAERTVGPVVVHTRLGVSVDGATTLDFPPFGRVSADTHAGPVAVTLSLSAIDLDALTAATAAGVPSAEEVQTWVAALRGAVVAAALRGALLAAAMAALVAWALTRSGRAVAAACALSVGLVAGSIVLAGATLDTGAFAEPRFEGVLARAPAAFSLVEQRFADVESLQRQLGSLASDLAAYYGVPQSFAQGGSLPGTYRVLHISDLHLDPVGMQLALDLASAYDVELVIDTGDITHFGTAQEAMLVLAQLGRRPYVFVPGNHDSPEIAAALAASGRVSVLDGETTTTARGLVVLGIGDPAGAGSDVEPDPTLAAKRGREVARALGARTSPGLRSPDVVAVHDPATGVPFAGTVPVVLSGHTHTAMLEWVDETVFLGSGTTGGVHFTELTTDPHIPHGAAILYFSVAEPGRLVAIDQIEVYGKTRQSTIRRTIVDEALLGQ